MYKTSIVMVGRPGGSPFLFSGPSLGGGYSLGFVSDQQYYNTAKAAVTSFDQLNERVRRIADKAARDKIITEYGMNDARPGDKSLNNASLSQRNQVADWIAKADATGDPGDGFADDGAHGRHRVDRLVSLVGDISSAVQDAELTYGTLAAPQAPPPPPQAGAPAPAPAASPVPYAIAGGVGILAILALTGVIKI